MTLDICPFYLSALLAPNMAQLHSVFYKVFQADNRDKRRLVTATVIICLFYAFIFSLTLF